ncbi:MAG: cupin-like domain-containing protein [bacterium]
MIKGKEHFKLVSPIFRKNIYAGVLEKYNTQFSPLDFFKIDYNMYPFAKQVKFIDAVLEAGDCIYIPAYYYIQSQTLTEA